MGGANNPATMVWVGSRLDAGIELFSPQRDAERSGAGFPTLNGSVDSDSKYFLVPELGYNRMLNNDLSVGVTVYGNGGMNTDYPEGNFNCGGGAANMLCGTGGLGVDLMQLVVAPTVSGPARPNSGYSSDSIRVTPPKSSSAWPTRPPGSTSRNFSFAPNACS